MPPQDDSKGAWKDWFALLVGLLIVAGMLAYLIKPETLEILAKLSPATLVLLLVVSSSAILAMGAQFAFAARCFKIELRALEWIALPAANSLFNYIPGRGGLVLRGAYMTRVYKLPLLDYVALTLMSFGGIIICYCLVGALAAFVLVTAKALPLWVPSLLLAIGLIGIVGMVVTPKLLPSDHRWSGQLNRMSDAIRYLLRTPSVLFGFSMSSLALVLARAFGCWILFDSFGDAGSGALSTFSASFRGASGVLSIAPGNLGVGEGALAAAATLAGADLKVATLVALTDRAVSLVAVIALGGAATPYLTRRAGADTSAE